MTYYIYALYDPRGDDVRYIGLTKNPSTRLKRHQGNHGNNSNIALRHWIMRIQIAELKPEMEILAEAKNRKEANELEMDWIDRYLERGFVVLNNRRREGCVFIDPFTFEIVPPGSGPQFTSWD